MNYAYTVCAEFDNPSVATEWVSWLMDGHINEVLAEGALEAVLVKVETAGVALARFEVRYRFEDAASFADYEKKSAPRLRAEGLAKFPPERGVRMTRTTGEIVVSRRR